MGSHPSPFRGIAIANLMLLIGLPHPWAESSDDQPASRPAGNAGPLGPIYLTGAVSGLGLWQNNISAGDQHSLASLSNGQFFFQKPDGVFRYFLQVGAYTLPALGTPYVNTPKATGDYFGPLPTAYLKLAPNAFSVEAGKLPTLIGAGYTFLFQNPNIERSLL